MDQSAIGADAIRTGVTNDAGFETASMDIHGFGHTCQDSLCGRCGKSTQREALSVNLRAGDVYENEGERPSDHRDTQYDDRFTGTPDEAIAGMNERTAAFESRMEIERIIAEAPPGTVKGGGGSSGRRRSKVAGTKVCLECGMTLCEHIASKRRGRPRFVDDTGRSEVMTVRVSASVKAAFDSGNVSAGKMLDSFMRYALEYWDNADEIAEGMRVIFSDGDAA